MNTFFRKLFKVLPFSCSEEKEVLTFDSEAAVAEAAEKENKILIMLKDDVYDVTSYLEEHPGGKEILLIAKGKIVDKMFAKYHYPLGEAPKLMKKFKIGCIKRNQTFDPQNETAITGA